MSLRDELRNRNISTDPIRNVLPFEHFALNSDLRFFMELFLMLRIEEYIPKSKDDHFYAAMVMNKKTKNIHMQVNVTQLLQHTISEQMYILAHEAAHLLLSHLIRVEKYDNPEALNIAEDAVINSLLNKYYKGALNQPTDDSGKKIGITIESLMEEKILPANFLENRSVDEVTSDEIYEILKKNSNNSNNGNNGNNSNNNSKDSSNSSCSKSGKISLEDLDNMRLDNHDGQPHPDDVNGDIKETIDNMIKAAKSNEYGSIAGNFVRELMEIVRKDFPFNQVLEVMLYKEKYDFSRPSRRIRLRDTTGRLRQTFIPRKRNQKFRVYAGIDVSGSCDDYIESFLGYIMGLPEFEEVVYCDTQIQNIVKKGDPIPNKVSGLGGTDLNPIMKRWEEFEKNKRGSEKLNFILLTDGEIPELEYGPRRSNVIVFTTHNTVNFKGASRPYLNILIDPEQR